MGTPFSACRRPGRSIRVVLWSYVERLDSARLLFGECAFDGGGCARRKAHGVCKTAAVYVEAPRTWLFRRPRFLPPEGGAVSLIQRSVYAADQGRRQPFKTAY
jgi:hypothetical protein